jgi:hypothetical protein
VDRVVAEEPRRGDVVIVRYADDFVMGFEHRHEAQAWYPLNCQHC